MPWFPLGRMRHTAGIMALKALAQIVRQPGIETVLINVALEDVNVVQNGLPSRSSPRWRSQARTRSAFAKASARQSTLSATRRAKTGGKGIRTPDIQLAKLALYQLSYAPDAECGF
jgi:hypothetical protein